MKSLRSCLFLLAGLLLAVSPARAAFNPAYVSSDARWVVYADLESLRASSLGKELVDRVEKAQLQSNKMPLGIDVQKVFTTLGTVTAYGSNFSTEPSNLDGALVIQGTADLRKIAEAALVQATITTPERVRDIAGQPFPIYAIFPDGPIKDAATAEAQQVFVAFPPEQFIFVSKSQAQLLRAREIVLGHAPSLARNPDSPLASLIGNAHSAYLFAASSVPPDAVLPQADATQSRILKMSRAGSLSLGENGPKTFIHAELLASSDAMADKLVKILQGMTAMVSLTENSDKDLTDFINSATVARNDDTVTLNLAYSSAKLSEMIQNVLPAAMANAAGVAGGARSPRDVRQSYGKVISEWKAPAQDPVKEGTPAVADTLLWQTIENVSLTPTSVITIASNTRGRVILGKNARFDRIEVSPSAGGSPLTFRAEYMKVVFGYQPDGKAAGSKLLAARTPVAAAQVQFPGAEGSYTIRVAYMSGADDITTLSLSVKDQAPVRPATDAAKSADH